MGDGDASDTGGDGVGTVADAELLNRIARRLDANERFSDVSARPEYAPDSVVADYDTGYYPADVSRAYLRVRWYENGDFSIHYTEQRGSDGWDCRWDRHPNPHNARDHFHPPPDAETPGEDRDFSDDWRDVLGVVLRELDARIEAFWG